APSLSSLQRSRSYASVGRLASIARRRSVGSANRASNSSHGRLPLLPLQPPPPPSSLLPPVPPPVEIVPVRFTMRVVAPGLVTDTVPGVVPVALGVKRA